MNNIISTVRSRHFDDEINIDNAFNYLRPDNFVPVQT